jgi:protein SCO1/2
MLFLVSVTARADDLPAGLTHVGVDQKLNEQVPLHLVFRDEHGQPIHLRDYFGRRPVILTLNYYDCPMLCPLELNDLLRAARAMPLAVGTDYDIVTVSIDPEDTPASAAEKKQFYAERYGRPGGFQGWHFLTGNPESIASLAEAVGFRYRRDPRSRQYAHAAGLVVLTADGRLARYFFGLEYSARDLRLALVDASQGRIGSLADQLLLFCFHYDPEAGRYNFAVLQAIRAAGVVTVIALGALMTVMLRRERVVLKKGSC